MHGIGKAFDITFFIVSQGGFTLGHAGSTADVAEATLGVVAELSGRKVAGLNSLREQRLIIAFPFHHTTFWRGFFEVTGPAVHLQDADFTVQIRKLRVAARVGTVLGVLTIYGNGPCQTTWLLLPNLARRWAKRFRIHNLIDQSQCAAFLNTFSQGVRGKTTDFLGPVGITSQPLISAVFQTPALHAIFTAFRRHIPIVVRTDA
ncbi:hypothetical protein Y5W_02889 [Alcanivorax sp. 521-1]|uniref:Uncharacterized protein n=1 Tax=Alloalcanivorax profundimaris TaxID=2735259 RepID=A0ABS0AWC8_9GAMM|nr:hypothetical protein [Alloalcanivorax profundimaris]